MDSVFKVKLEQTSSRTNTAIAEALDCYQIHPRMAEAMRYTLEAPGKRLRGALVLLCCELINGKVNKAAQAAAAAIEMVHTYSLIHDDLPAMDDDDLRRGRPSCHKKFDEATAILAGDALLTLTFEHIAKEVKESKMAVRMITVLSEAAGAGGMIAGQMADLLAENSGGGKKMLEYIHTNKTAKMFRAACQLGAIAGGANKRQLAALSDYGLKLGLGFQIADDILDITAESAHLGKTAGKDAEHGKLTYPSLIGLEKSKKQTKKITEQAIASIKIFGEKGEMLRQLAEALLERTK